MVPGGLRRPAIAGPSFYARRREGNWCDDVLLSCRVRPWRTAHASDSDGPGIRPSIMSIILLH